MTKAKKKKNFTLLLLLVLMIALIVGYVVYEKVMANKSKSDQGEGDSDQTAILTLDEDSLSKISYKNQSIDTELTLVKGDDGTWSLEDEVDVPLGRTNVNNMVSVVTDLESSKVVMENCDDLSQFGLDNPNLVIRVTTTDGQENTINVGEQSPLADGFYVTLNGANTVYLAGTSVNTYFSKTKTDLIEVASAPTITDTNITNLLVEDTKNGNFELSYDEKAPYDYSGTAICPYAVIQGYEISMAADTDAVKTFFDNYCSLSYSSCVEYNCSDLATYGLKDPRATVTIDYYEETADSSDSDSTGTTDSTDTSSNSDSAKTIRTDYKYQLQIGDLNEDESSYYVRDTSNNSVMLMSKDTVDKMLEFNKFDVLEKYVQLINIKTVSSVDVVANGLTHTLKNEVIKAKDSDSEDSKDTTKFWLDDKEYDEDSARDLYQNLLMPKYDQLLPKDYKGHTGDPVATVIFHRTSAEYPEVTVSYYEYDNSFYVVNRNGEEYFLVDKRAVDDLVSDIADSAASLSK